MNRNRNTYAYQLRETYANNLDPGVPPSLRYASVQCEGNKAHINAKGEWICGLGQDKNVIYGKQYLGSDIEASAEYSAGQCVNNKSLKIPNDPNGFWICSDKIPDGSSPYLYYTTDSSTPTTHKYTIDVSKTLCSSGNAFQLPSGEIMCGTRSVADATDLKDARSICNGNAYKNTSNKFVCGLQGVGNPISSFGKSEFESYFK